MTAVWPTLIWALWTACPGIVAELAFGGASLKETLDLADYLLDSGHDADTLLVEVSFYTLNAGYNTDRFATLEETLNNPLAYCFNLEYNVNALTVAMDTLRGTPDTIESGDWVAADYLADDGTVFAAAPQIIRLHRDHHAALQSWALNDEHVNRLHTPGPALPERGRAAHRSFAADGRQCADRGLRCVRHHRDHAGHGAATLAAWLMNAALPCWITSGAAALLPTMTSSFLTDSIWMSDMDCRSGRRNCLGI